MSAFAAAPDSPNAPAPETSGSRQAVFHARRVSKVYRMGEVEVHALRGVDLDLYAGELVVLLGASGSGKSTLLNILGGLDTPTSGEVFYLDHDLTAAGDEGLTRFRREHVGFVFQFYNLIPSLTALENVALWSPRSPSDPLDPARGARTGRAGRSGRSFPGAALGRRAAAGGDRARGRQAARRAAVRRADRGARLRHAARWCSRCWRGSTASSARPPRSSPTTPRSPPWPTASSTSAAAQIAEILCNETQALAGGAVTGERRCAHSTASCCATCGTCAGR